MSEVQDGNAPVDTPARRFVRRTASRLASRGALSDDLLAEVLGLCARIYPLPSGGIRWAHPSAAVQRIYRELSDGFSPFIPIPPRVLVAGVVGSSNQEKFASTTPLRVRCLTELTDATKGLPNEEILRKVVLLELLRIEAANNRAQASQSVEAKLRDVQRDLNEGVVDGKDVRVRELLGRILVGDALAPGILLLDAIEHDYHRRISHALIDNDIASKSKVTKCRIGLNGLARLEIPQSARSDARMGWLSQALFRLQTSTDSVAGVIADLRTHHPSCIRAVTLMNGEKDVLQGAKSLDVVHDAYFKPPKVLAIPEADAVKTSQRADLGATATVTSQVTRSLLAVGDLVYPRYEDDDCELSYVNAIDGKTVKLLRFRLTLPRSQKDTSGKKLPRSPKIECIGELTTDDVVTRAMMEDSKYSVVPIASLVRTKFWKKINREAIDSVFTAICNSDGDIRLYRLAALDGFTFNYPDELSDRAAIAGRRSVGVRETSPSDMTSKRAVCAPGRASILERDGNWVLCYVNTRDQTEVILIEWNLSSKETIQRDPDKKQASALQVASVRGVRIPRGSYERYVEGAIAAEPLHRLLGASKRVESLSGADFVEIRSFLSDPATYGQLFRTAQQSGIRLNYVSAPIPERSGRSGRPSMSIGEIGH